MRRITATYRYTAMTRLCSALGVPRGITAIVGSGGKTSLINRLAAELCADAKVLRATTTHIYPPADDYGITLLSPTFDSLADAFTRTRLVTVGEVCLDGKLRAPCADMLKLADIADYALIEADGSRGMPVKAPNVSEPVLTGEERLILAVIGATGFYMPISEAAHRAELYASLVGKPISAPIEPRDAAFVIERAYSRLAKPPYRFMVVINQCDSEEFAINARACASLLHCDCALVSLEKRTEWLEIYRDGERLV